MAYVTIVQKLCFDDIIHISNNINDQLQVGVAGRSVRSFCINGHHLGPKTWPIYGVERWPHIRGF